MAEVPGSMLIGVTLCCRIFLFSHSKASDVNISIIVNFGYFVKNSCGRNDTLKEKVACFNKNDRAFLLGWLVETVALLQIVGRQVLAIGKWP